jgi:hypothetical protein
MKQKENIWTPTEYIYTENYIIEEHYFAQSFTKRQKNNDSKP